MQVIMWNTGNTEYSLFLVACLFLYKRVFLDMLEQGLANYDPRAKMVLYPVCKTMTALCYHSWVEQLKQNLWPTKPKIFAQACNLCICSKTKLLLSFCWFACGVSCSSGVNIAAIYNYLGQSCPMLFSYYTQFPHIHEEIYTDLIVCFVLWFK